jgi:exodeoxyribonuclease VII small subunit
MMKAKKDAKNSLESSLKRLEEIVEILERGETPLDDAVSLYEEGVQISKACAEKLKTAELKIKKISKDMNGQFTVNESDAV